VGREGSDLANTFLPLSAEPQTTGYLEVAGRARTSTFSMTSRPDVHDARRRSLTLELARCDVKLGVLSQELNDDSVVPEIRRLEVGEINVRVARQIFEAFLAQYA